jgi:hypothetical protein
MKAPNKYRQPKKVPVPNFAGYPNKINTQTVKMNYVGAATKGTKTSNRFA